MGLDKWLKSEDDIIKSKKKKPSIQDKKRKSEGTPEKLLEKKSVQLTKYTLICQNSKCKYQKTLIKKELTDDDKTCPRCNKIMKTKVG